MFFFGHESEKMISGRSALKKLLVEDFLKKKKLNKTFYDWLRYFFFFNPDIYH